jgi:hypothetical protein
VSSSINLSLDPSCKLSASPPLQPPPPSARSAPLRRAPYRGAAPTTHLPFTTPRTARFPRFFSPRFLQPTASSLRASASTPPR